jgi:hypothetical protein
MRSVLLQRRIRRAEVRDNTWLHHRPLQQHSSNRARFGQRWAPTVWASNLYVQGMPARGRARRVPWFSARVQELRAGDLRQHRSCARQRSTRSRTSTSGLCSPACPTTAASTYLAPPSSAPRIARTAQRRSLRGRGVSRAQFALSGRVRRPRPQPTAQYVGRPLQRASCVPRGGDLAGVHGLDRASSRRARRRSGSRCCVPVQEHPPSSSAA